MVPDSCLLSQWEEMQCNAKNVKDSTKIKLYNGNLLPRWLCGCSVAQSCLTLCDPMDCNTPGFPVHHQLPELTQTHVHRVGDAIQPSHPLLTLLLPSIFANIRVFSKERVLCIRWPKYWSFSFSPSNEYSGLISFTGPWVPIKIL